MHPAPIKVTSLAHIPTCCTFVETLASGESIYHHPFTGAVYALQPAHSQS